MNPRVHATSPDWGWARAGVAGGSLLAAAATAALVSGCAFGNQHAYRTVVPNLSASGAGPIAVAVHDQRADVVSGEEEPNYVGNQRGGWGNVFDVTTEGNGPLSDDWAFAVAAGLRARGFQTTTVTTTPQDKPEAVLARLQGAGAPLQLLFVLREWYCDTYQNVTLHRDVLVAVMNGAGQLIAQSQVQGEEELGGSFWDPPAHAREVMPVAFARALEAALNDPRIVAALQGSAAPGS